MNTLEKITAIKAEVNRLPFTMRAAYTNGIALRNLYNEGEKAALFQLQNHNSPDVFSIQNNSTNLICFTRSEEQIQLTSAKHLLDLSEGSPAFQEALAAIEPKLAEISALEAELAAENANRENARIALAEAEETALESARKAALESPAVAKARAALAAIDAPPLKKARTAHEEIGEVS